MNRSGNRILTLKKTVVQTAQKLHRSDRALIEQHQKYILQLACSNNDPVAISLYLQKQHIYIQISSLRSFLRVEIIETDCSNSS